MSRLTLKEQLALLFELKCREEGVPSNIREKERAVSSSQTPPTPLNQPRSIDRREKHVNTTSMKHSVPEVSSRKQESPPHPVAIKNDKKKHWTNTMPNGSCSTLTGKKTTMSETLREEASLSSQKDLCPRENTLSLNNTCPSRKRSHEEIKSISPDPEPSDTYCDEETENYETEFGSRSDDNWGEADPYLGMYESDESEEEEEEEFIKGVVDVAADPTWLQIIPILASRVPMMIGKLDMRDRIDTASIHSIAAQLEAVNIRLHHLGQSLVTEAEFGSDFTLCSGAGSNEHCANIECLHELFKLGCGWYDALYRVAVNKGPKAVHPEILINNIKAKELLKVEVYPHVEKGTFVSRVIINGEEFGQAQSPTRRDAKKDSCSACIQYLEGIVFDLVESGFRFDSKKAKVVEPLFKKVKKNV